MKPLNEPSFSIITVVLNGAETIEKTIISVLKQKYLNFEFIIIDGGSTDSTLSIINKYSNSITNWCSEKDDGVYDAFNKGVKIAKNDWIVFIGSDDELVNDALFTYAEYIKTSKIQLDYISAKAQIITKNGICYEILGKPYSYQNSRKKMSHIHTGSAHNKRIFEKFGLFDSSFKISGDYEFFLRIKGKIEYLFIDKIMVIARMGGISYKNLKVYDEDKEALIISGERSVFSANIIKYHKILRFYIKRILYKILGPKTSFIIKRFKNKI